MVGGDLFVTAAIGTKRFTKRKMDVEADAICIIGGGGPLSNDRFPVCHINMLLPVGYRRITCITRNGHIVFLQKSGRYHRAKIFLPKGEEYDENQF
jgi:hypothetical protein